MTPEDNSWLISSRNRYEKSINKRNQSNFIRKFIEIWNYIWFETTYKTDTYGNENYLNKKFSKSSLSVFITLLTLITLIIYIIING